MNNPQQWRFVMDAAVMGINDWPLSTDMAIPKLPSKLAGCAWEFDEYNYRPSLVTPSGDKISFGDWHRERGVRGLDHPIVTGQQESPEPEFTPADQVEWGHHDNNDLTAFISAIAGDAPGRHKELAESLLQTFIIATQE